MKKQKFLLKIFKIKFLLKWPNKCVMITVFETLVERMQIRFNFVADSTQDDMRSGKHSRRFKSYIRLDVKTSGYNRVGVITIAVKSATMLIMIIIIVCAMDEFSGTHVTH